MAASPNPRNPDPFSTPPPLTAAGIAAVNLTGDTPTTTPAVAGIGAVNLAGGTPASASANRDRTPASRKNPVLLCDWWLVAAAEDVDGRRLCVGGMVAARCPRKGERFGERSGSKSLLSPWKKAERVFVSAPITERYDTSTLGTADGITVRLQGVVNQARSHHNGFSLEVCSSFLIGFPFNWDDYAIVPTRSASANDISKGLADGGGCLFHLDEFTTSRINDASLDGSVTRMFKDFLNMFGISDSVNITELMSSDGQEHTSPKSNSSMPRETQDYTSSKMKSSLPHESPSKEVRKIVLTLDAQGLEHIPHHEVSCSSPSGNRNILIEDQGLTPLSTKSEKDKYEEEINRQKHEDVINYVVEGHFFGPSEAVQGQKYDLQAYGVVGENSTSIITNSGHHFSPDSTLKVNRLLVVKEAEVQKVPSLECIPEQVNCNQLGRSVTVSPDSISRIPDCREKADSESSTSLADGVVDENSISLAVDVQHTVSLNSSTSEVDRILVERTDAQIGGSLETIPEPENSIQLARSRRAPAQDTINGIPNIIGDATGESITCLMDPGTENFGNDQPPKDLKLLNTKHDMKLRNVKRVDGSEGTSTQILGVFKGSFTGNVSDVKDGNSSNPCLEISRETIVSLSSKASNNKGKVCRRSSRIASIPRQEILETNVNSEFHVVKDFTASVTSEVGLTESFVDPVGSRDGLMILKNSKTDQKCAKCVSRKSCMHKTPRKPHESSVINQLELDMMDRSLHGAPNQMLSTKNDTAHIQDGSNSRNVVRKLYYTTCSGRLVGSSTRSESQCLEEMVKKGTQNGEDIKAIDYGTLASRISRVKKRRRADQISSDLKAEQTGGRSVRVDHSYENAMNDGKCKQSHMAACDVGTDRAKKVKLKTLPRELHVDSAPTCDTQGGKFDDGLTSVITGHGSEFVKCPTAKTTPSEIILGAHSREDKKLDVTIRKSQSIRLKKKPFSQPGYKKGRSSNNSGKTIWRPSYDNQFPLTRDTAKRISIATPESLDFKRSRSGRLLVPPIDKWCQKIIYGKDGEITGITGEGLENFPFRGTNSEPPRKKKKCA